MTCDVLRITCDGWCVQVLEREFQVALTDLSKAEMEVRERRLAVATYEQTSDLSRHVTLLFDVVVRYEQKVEEAKRMLASSEVKLVELKRNVESVREKVHQSLDDAPPDSKVKKSKSSLDGVPTFKPVTIYKPKP